MNEEYCDYLKFIEDALGMAKAIPRYFSRFSNKIYCNHQKFAIYVLMQKFKTSTRGIASILRACSDMRMLLGLDRIPSHSTIVRFANKIRKSMSHLLGICQASTVAIDATGFELESKSYYYRTVWNSNRRKKTKRFMKLSVAADASKQIILAFKIRKSRAHDSRDFKFLCKKLSCKHVVADKGYDSNELRRFVRDKLNARPHIPYRNTSGIPKRGRRILPPDKDIYGKRAIVENIFFCIKRKYGSVLRNRSLATQKAELISKLLAHNVDRMQHYILLILEGCTSTLNRKVYIYYNNTFY